MGAAQHHHLAAAAERSMSETIAAHTKSGAEYPGYVNISRIGVDAVRITVRAAPVDTDGRRLCGVTCSPGGANCNNYCASDRGQPIPDAPERHLFKREGATSQLVLTWAEWSAVLGEASRQAQRS